MALKYKLVMLIRFYYITVRFLRHDFQFDTFDVEGLEVADNLQQILGIRKNRAGFLSMFYITSLY